MERKILLLGSGYVAGPCLDYLWKRPENIITIGARRKEAGVELAQGRDRIIAVAVDAADEAALDAQVALHDIIISLIPYTQHAKVIKSAVKHGKHVVTTSYISPAMMEFDQAAKDKNLTIFNEIGVDPGIDHLYAVKAISEVHQLGGKIVGFTSYCGGLPAPEASNNPLGYKFSWSVRGVLMALRNNAKFLEDGKVVDIEGPQLMDSAKPIFIYPGFAFEGYANRDSTPYSERYHIPEAKTVIRGTLRYQGFPKFIKALVLLGMLSEEPLDYLAASAAPITWKNVMAQLLGVSSQQESDLITAVIEKAHLKGSEAERITRGLKWLGLFSDDQAPKAGNIMDTLCATLGAKMQYQEGERDMTMLQHVFDCELPDGTKQIRTSTGLWFGEPSGVTSMARTVGVPCGITTQLILDGVITRRGVVAPMDMEVIQPILEKLEGEGIYMKEEIL
ncbi:hypothetical protein SmJEL517_g05564 [Synchytrium microbalum]|uniref:Saccharopine dehydrogenase [NADP(+), L-glutamate-forming] n=1 Tax=Synchytrium microbalum TaxID=1806994 RepID=A0A507BTV9_9FUNG|nr:uncharacterized protein SmJEL517_g05564 [Synchytrium microbalum]TPX31022.1 hypothetical protein SmJEL517_g05564 [Synchytrium microbalum]